MALNPMTSVLPGGRSLRRGMGVGGIVKRDCLGEEEGPSPEASRQSVAGPDFRVGQNPLLLFKARETAVCDWSSPRKVTPLL